LAEQDYQREKAFMDVLFDNSPEAISVSDEQGRLVRVNAKFLELFGFAKEEVIGNKIDKLIARGKYYKEAVEITHHVTLSGKTTACESIRFRKDGTPVDVSIIATPIHAGDLFIGGYGIYRNITGRKRAELQLARQTEELTELNATKDKFFSIIAHDLKNPFNNIFGITDILITDFHELDKNLLLTYLSIIQNSSKQAYSLLENLLLWARAQTGTIAFQPEVFDLRSSILGVIELLETQAKTKRITISSCISDHCSINADKNMFETIVRNLFTNAIKFTPRNGKIIASVVKQKDQVEISVRDTGVGIEKEYMEFIFRIEKKTTTLGTDKETGSGLGLIICKEFVEKHGGKIWMESEPGLGSNIKFTIPSLK